MQDCSISIANALELLHYCTKLSIFQGVNTWKNEHNGWDFIDDIF